MTTSEFTTIYLKFCGGTMRTEVYAVVWLKTSKQLVIGLSLPETVESPRLSPPPHGMKYKGLTKYLTLSAGDTLPDSFADWAKLAFEAATTGAPG